MDDDDLEAIDSPMQRFVDARDLDGLLTAVSADEIAAAWHRYSATPKPKSYDHEDWWAVELFMGTEIFQRTDLHRLLLLKLIEHGSDDALGSVAAGPLENFVSDDEDDLRWLEVECAVNDRLRAALPGIWAWSSVSERTMARLDAAAGEQLPRPMPESEWPPELVALRSAERRLDELTGRIGGMSAFHKIDHPTEQQRLAAHEYEIALEALMGWRPPKAEPRDRASRYY